MNSTSGRCSLISSIFIVVIVVKSSVKPRANIPEVIKTSTFIACWSSPIIPSSPLAVTSKVTHLLALVTLWVVSCIPLAVPSKVTYLLAFSHFR
ncbi:hypothetical protein Tco_1096502 [Tanacetum coccineum]